LEQPKKEEDEDILNVRPLPDVINVALCVADEAGLDCLLCLPVFKYFIIIYSGMTITDFHFAGPLFDNRILSTFIHLYPPLGKVEPNIGKGGAKH
jgi:hypothetical protein